ncbi:MAG: 2-C-methyl-D-erythritol 2,4-cyclodiphosphate synthase [Candidatus Diapherotrites archaeon]|nr:2-C-methyl-D-erythritol 2,4-cyclodiphosphate synthase [Candidatus Diapherotrites archaeon]MDZ4256360.1 2-C-methyl-D-erythritol 2,4-cyclodiphosphate synthase [archaeon]
MFRIGLGVDSHAFENPRTEKKLIMGGVEVPHHVGMRSHSDGDVVLHALFNALSSALGEKSIGQFFPDSDTANKGKDSRQFVSFIMERARDKGYGVENVVVSLECQTPKIAPIEMDIRKNVSQLLNIPLDAIAIHATSGEGLTPFGQGKGIYCQCVVLLHQTHK